MHDKHQVEESGNEIASITTVNVAQWTNNKICMDNDDTKNSPLGAMKHLKTQGIKHMILLYIIVHDIYYG
jgi:hypothetical protein